MKQYKVWVLAVGETKWATNGLVFDTVKEAKAWGEDLLCKWFCAQHFAVLPLAGTLVGLHSVDYINEHRVSDDQPLCSSERAM